MDKQKFVDLDYARDFQKGVFAQLGHKTLSNGTPSITDEQFHLIICLDNAVFNYKNASDNNYGDIDVTSFSLSAGDSIPGNFHDITVTSGRLFCCVSKQV